MLAAIASTEGRAVMMKKFVLGLALVLGLTAHAAPALPDNNFVYVIGHGEVSIAPDRARIEVTVRASGPDQEKAFAQLQADSKAVIAAALALGVPERDIDAHRIGKNFRYEPSKFDSGSRVALPELEQTVHFELRDLDKAVALADRVLKMQSVSGVSTSFYVADVQTAEAAATTKAAADAQQRGQELAKLFGRKLGRATALSVEPDSAMRERFGGNGARAEAVIVTGNRAGTGYRLPNAIDFAARLYVVYALE
jgi:uncharacterized protein YggE